MKVCITRPDVVRWPYGQKNVGTVLVEGAEGTRMLDMDGGHIHEERWSQVRGLCVSGQTVAGPSVGLHGLFRPDPDRQMCLPQVRQYPLRPPGASLCWHAERELRGRCSERAAVSGRSTLERQDDRRTRQGYARTLRGRCYAGELGRSLRDRSDHGLSNSQGQNLARCWGTPIPAQDDNHQTHGATRTRSRRGSPHRRTMCRGCTALRHLGEHGPQHREAKGGA